MIIPYDTVIMIRANIETIAIKTGQPNSDVVEECRNHCYFLVKNGVNNKTAHAGFLNRVENLNKKYPHYLFSEIVAMNTKNDPIAAAQECHRQWRLSPSHWEALCRPADIYGFSLCHHNDEYYGMGLFGKKS